jgi:hypothetical protein
MNRARASLYLLTLGLLLAGARTATAQSTTPGLVGTGPDPSLVLFIWDPVNKVSYSHDTGYTGLTLFNGLTSAATGGQQTFITIDPAKDSNFAQFLQASPDLSQDLWLVAGGGYTGSGFTANQSNIFTTMVNTVLVNNQPTKNPEWDTLTSVTNQVLKNTTPQFGTVMYAPLNAGNGGTSATYNTYATAVPGEGSSFDSSASNGYLGNMRGLFMDATGLATGDMLLPGVDSGNVVGATGSSSWFYYLTSSNTDPKKITTSAKQAPISVTAFNSGDQLAYWGLARTTNAGNQQELVLSFTLPPAMTATITAAGVARRNGTDYIASYGSARLIDMPTTGAVLTTAVVAAVPEPSSWLLMAGGLAGVFAAARRQRQRT